ncbi:AAA family ATPase [Paenarthrobacter sp. DKR-5]|uniref:AAA family ATPase n=1 Tax=Paenarthrobacter sp. DKR-5 TaxID=2835535 RepID=UPI001BDC3B47|nr:AAA family ATPase [Paenarthrobacter sp. DKR-5]MBT1003981.1 AAA family ATPase [Paenarthrobacter sp. DKR-5]
MIILVAHQKGGVGKSTVAVNVAVELSARGKDVIIVEADPTVHTSSNWAKDREEAGHSPIQTVQKTGNLRATLLDLDNKYDVVLVDAPGKDSSEMRTAMTAADMILVPIQPTQPDLDTTQGLVITINQAKDFNPDLKALAVLNRVPTNVFSDSVREARSYLSEFPELRVAQTRLHERKAYQNSLSEGLGVVEMKDGKARAEIQLLTEEVLTW